MKVVVVLMLVAVTHLAGSISTFPKKKNGFSGNSKFNSQTINSNHNTRVPRDEVTFQLWTRDNSNLFSPLYHGRLLDEPSIRPNKPFKFMIHGWLGDFFNWGEYMKDEYLKKDDYNIVAVVWLYPATDLYSISVKHTEDVGIYVGELIVDLNETLGVPFENIHIIGHSLGAHVSGYAGRKVKNVTSKMVGRITGLDPAGPMFFRNSIWSQVFSVWYNGLNRNDALYVDAIHTDVHNFGYVGVFGHADFYPNGGTAIQPGCILKFSCSHFRAVYFFGESINSEEFIARLCSTYEEYKRGECQQNKLAIMGENIEIGTQGIYYLTTHSHSPYAKNDEYESLLF